LLKLMFLMSLLTKQKLPQGASSGEQTGRTRRWRTGIEMGTKENSEQPKLERDGLMACTVM